MPLDQLDRLHAVARLADDLQLRPDLGQARAQLLAHQALVVGDDRGGGEGLAERRCGGRAPRPPASDQPRQQQRAARQHQQHAGQRPAAPSTEAATSATPNSGRPRPSNSAMADHREHQTHDQDRDAQAEPFRPT